MSRDYDSEVEKASEALDQATSGLKKLAGLVDRLSENERENLRRACTAIMGELNAYEDNKALVELIFKEA